MARIPSSSRAKTRRKEIIVSVFLTESTASLVNPKIPYLEDLHPNDSEICVINSSETNYAKNSSSLDYINQKNSFDNRSLISDVAYFQYGSYSSLSVPETSSQDSGRIYPLKIDGQVLPYVLKPTKIHTRPLVAVRSLAHDDRLNIHLNKIYVSLLKSQTSLTSDFICRICHGGESVADLLKPCRCRGSVALVHLKCLERWLSESSRSYCELCQHHYNIIRKPRHSLITSVVLFIISPGPNMWDRLIDTAAFLAYTPTAMITTYSLMILCENLARSEGNGTYLPLFIGCLAVLGIAAIDFTYTSWLMTTLQKHYVAWQEFRRNNSDMKLILPKFKKTPYRKKDRTQSDESD